MTKEIDCNTNTLLVNKMISLNEELHTYIRLNESYIKTVTLQSKIITKLEEKIGLLEGEPDSNGEVIDR